LSLTVKSIYGEIGPGERIALSKLAIEKFEETSRPLRIAIDISIWQFQIQAGQGGSNPAIRTFYYRLLRLLSMSVQPLFVFDGPHKPPFKRNKRTGHQGGIVPNLLCKQLLNLFGFPFHIAPGEAEAECALLQREGIVDAVLSEDVDTLMFGCGLTMRNWSSEGSRGNKSPTHVSLYDAKVTKQGKSGLDREGMVLVALMSGGDYITEGIPGCGIKLACEAARAGFGKSLCQLSRSDVVGLDTWRKKLSHEIQTNESKYFRCKHKALKIPDNFPDKEVLAYYTHPVVSSASKLQRLKDEICWDGEVNILGLRLFVGEAFDWIHKIGAKKFIRGLAPVLLVHKLRVRADRRDSRYGDVVLTAMQEMELVRAICGKRCHFSTDGIPELRVVYHPNDIVGIDLDAEEDDSEDYGRDGLAPLNEDDEIEAYASDDVASRSRCESATKRAAIVYDPTQPDKLWIPETIARVGIPLKVEDYEESLRDPRKFLKAKSTAKKALRKGGMPQGAIEKFVKISKPGLEETSGNASKVSKKIDKMMASTQPALSPEPLAPRMERTTSSRSAPTATAKSTTARPAHSVRSSDSREKEGANTTSKATSKTKGKSKVSVEKPPPNANPWTLTRSSPTTQSSLIISKTFEQTTKSTKPPPLANAPPIIGPSPSVAHNYSQSRILDHPRRKHAHSPSPENGQGLIILASSPPTTHPDQLLTPSTGNKDPFLPSPRKKRSPLSLPKITPPELPQSICSRTETVSPESASRKLDFQPTPSASSSSPALPSLDQVLTPTEGLVNKIINVSSSPAIVRPSHINMSPGWRPPKSITNQEILVNSKAKFPQKKYIMLRDSLPGTWKEVQESQVPERRGRAWRISQVEVVDLSEQ